MSESDNKSIGNSEENEHDFQMLQSPILKKNEFNFDASQFKPISTINGLPTLTSPSGRFKDLLNGTTTPPPHPHMVFPGSFLPPPFAPMGLPPFNLTPLTGKFMQSPMNKISPPRLPFVPPMLNTDDKSSPPSSLTKISFDPNTNHIGINNPLLKRTLFSSNPLQNSALGNHMRQQLPRAPGTGPHPMSNINGGNPHPSLPPFPGMQCPGGSPSNPMMPMNLPHGFPIPHAAFFHPLFPFPLGRDLKQIKKWGRTKRKKGKVVIDKETGRKLITAITCVACFKAKKKCIYANGQSKRCNYCANRRIECVKRLDRRCQKIWHESGRQARFKTSGEHISKKKQIEYVPATKEEEEKENLNDISNLVDSKMSQLPELPSPLHNTLSN